ncbi:sterol desaturase family protein [Salipiger mucosus]|uniref:Sterol desaturase n=1 Tax=Salipiger mucosus DSM 16094 TaxID=1123237 RepID=S9QP88_9RHOB|nr:sterol desaturase family protein [Salipiger mucosus]EPX81408.1 Sterol desaturase [Salipiger mucosus DSM 16094]
MSIDALRALFETKSILQVIGFISLINLGLTLAEVLLDLTTRKERRWKDTAANCAIFVVNQVLETTAFATVGLLGLLPVYWLVPWELPMVWWSWVLAFFAADLTYYWMHRIEHERRILWASHSVHHSSQNYNLTVGFRLSWVESLFEWLFLIPMVLLGFNPFQAIIGLILVAQYQHWVHTEHVRQFGWLDEVFNTPSVHRVHHGSNRKYLDKNYGGVLILWDKLFGTLQREEDKVIYGLTWNIDTNNPVTINFIEYRNIWRDMRRCRTWSDRLWTCFGRLTWQPDYLKPQKSDRNSAVKESTQ